MFFLCLFFDIFWLLDHSQCVSMILTLSLPLSDTIGELMCACKLCYPIWSKKCYQDYSDCYPIALPYIKSHSKWGTRVCTCLSPFQNFSSPRTKSLKHLKRDEGKKCRIQDTVLLSAVSPGHHWFAEETQQYLHYSTPLPRSPSFVIMCQQKLPQSYSTGVTQVAL